jgi:hypothetical protein
MTPWYAVSTFQNLLLEICLFAIGYGLLLRRLATIVQPHRLRLAEHGEKYLAVCKDQEERGLIKFYLDKAFSPWITIWAFVSLPIVLIHELVRPAKFDFVPSDEEGHRTICRLFIISVFAANPLFGTLVAVELLIATIVVALVAGNVVLIKRAILAMMESQATRRGDRRIIPAH